MTRRKTTFWVIIIFLLPTLACSLTGGGGEESASSQVSLGEEATSTPVAAPPEVVEETEQLAEEPTAPAEPPAPASGPFAAGYGFADFDSFRVNSVLEFEGARGDVEGESTDAVQSYLLDVTRNPPARYMRVTIKNVGTIAADAETEYYMIDGVTYTQAFDTWIAQDGKMGASQFSNPATFAPLPATATCDAAPTDVNGVSAIHCTFTAEDMRNRSIDAATLSGDVWVAQDGNYVVKYALEATDVNSKGAFEGSSLKHFDVYRTRYELSDINGDISIELPAAAAGTEVIDMAELDGSTSGLSAPDNAEIILDNSAVLMYFTPDMTTANIAAFHREALTGAGWQELPDDSYVEEYNMLLAFEGEGGVLRLFASQDIDGGFFVSATLPFEIPGGDSAPAGDAGADSGGTAAPAPAAPDLPLLDDATEVMSMAGFTSYNSQRSIADVLQFYRDQLTPLGWAEDETASFSDNSTGLLMFNKDNQTLLLTLSAEGGTTTVGLVVTAQ